MYCKKTIIFTTITENTRTQIICLLNSFSCLLYYMKTCLADKVSIKGLTTALVAKQNISPKVIEIGRAGKALRQMANSSRVRQRPMRMATKQAIVVVQSP